MEFKEGDIVECVDTTRAAFTLGKEYVVISADSTGLTLRNNNGNIGWYYKRRFKLKTSNMEKELKITKDKVLAAAAKCSTAKATLETLFPEAFEDEDLINSDSVTYKEYPYAKCLRLNDRVDLITAYAKQQGYKGLILNSSFNWELKKINGSLSLIPTRKPS